jgi:hypothetical protein
MVETSLDDVIAVDGMRVFCFGDFLGKQVLITSPSESGIRSTPRLFRPLFLILHNICQPCLARVGIKAVK